MEIKNSYWEQERVCETKFLEGGPFFLLTIEDLPWLLFETEEDFKEGTNVIAISLAYLPIKLLVDVQMNNHLHLLFEGYQTDVTCFVTRLRKQILAFLHRKGRSLRSWNIQIQPITDFRHFRNASMLPGILTSHIGTPLPWATDGAAPTCSSTRISQTTRRDSHTSNSHIKQRGSFAIPTISAFRILIESRAG